MHHKSQNKIIVSNTTNKKTNGIFKGKINM